MRSLKSAAIGLLGVALCMLANDGVTAKAPGRAAPRQTLPTTVRWFGHSSFLVTSSSGLRIVLDPFAAGVGYPLPHPTADIVTVSHEHFDHNATGEVRGHFLIVRGAGEHVAKSTRFHGIASPHGEGRGANTIFTFAIDGIRFCHLGDLGTALSEAQVRAIGTVDVLMIPVGGHFTIDAAQATRIVEQLNPRIVLPMHYRTAAVSPGLRVLAPIDPFLERKGKVVRLNANTLTLSKGKLPEETAIYLLRYE